MTHLCIDARMAFSSGIGTYIREIVPFLKDHFQITLLVSELGKSWCEGFDQIEFKASIYSIKEQLLFSEVIPPCDLFWSPHYNVPIFPIRAKKRITTIHDVCHLRHGKLFQRIYAKTLLKKALRSDRVFTISLFSKKEIEHFFGPHRIDVIHIGVNRNRFCPKEASENVREKYLLPKKYALFVGSLKKHKNLKNLKRAFEDEELALVCVGKGLQEIEEEDLSSVYSMAELLVFPSFYEGFGLPLLEAMSSGCPVAASFCASIPEVCSDAVSYFDPRSQEQMKKAIQKVLLQRERWVQKGQTRASFFSWERSAQKHISLFKEV